MMTDKQGSCLEDKKDGNKKINKAKGKYDNLAETKANENTDESISKIDHFLVIVCFVAFGALLHCVFAVIISGAQDILAGTLIPTTSIILSHVTPIVVVTATAPWFIQHVSYLVRVLAIFFFMSVGLLLIIFNDNVYAKICGVSLNAVAHGLGEMTFLALSTFYCSTAVASFAAGSGAGMLLGPVYYSGMTSWACQSPRIALLVVSPSPIIILIFYYLLDKSKVTSYSRAVIHHGVQYSSLPHDTESTQNMNTPTTHALTWEEKITAVRQILPWILSLSVAYIAQYLTIQSIFTTIAFQHAPFEPRDHYIFYILLNYMGEFFTRSYLSVISCAKPTLVPRFVIKQTWVLSFLLVCVTVIAVCASWYRFFHNVGILLFLSFAVGALSGLVYSSTVCAVPEIVEPKYQEFCLGIVTIGESFGALLASILGFYVEPALRRHCVTISELKVECITRPPEQRWNAAACKLLGDQLVTAPRTTDF